MEAGVGRGDLLARYPHPSNLLFGCDISEGNIEGCKMWFDELRRPVHLCHADLEHLPYRDRSFDVVYSLSVLWYVPSLSIAVDELFRVAKPGGLVVFDMLNAWHVTSLANHGWRILCRLAGRELGRTTLTTPRRMTSLVKRWSNDFHIYGNYLLLPTFLPVLKEAGNWCKWFPRLSYAMTESPMRLLSHKLLVVARKS